MGVTLQLNDHEVWVLKHGLLAQAARLRERAPVLGTEQEAMVARGTVLGIHARLVNPTST